MKWKFKWKTKLGIEEEGKDESIQIIKDYDLCVCKNLFDKLQPYIAEITTKNRYVDLNAIRKLYEVDSNDFEIILTARYYGKYRVVLQSPKYDVPYEITMDWKRVKRHYTYRKREKHYILSSELIYENYYDYNEQSKYLEKYQIARDEEILTKEELTMLCNEHNDNKLNKILENFASNDDEVYYIYKDIVTDEFANTRKNIIESLYKENNIRHYIFGEYKNIIDRNKTK